jgi:hypothetical protein
MVASIGADRSVVSRLRAQGPKRAGAILGAAIASAWLIGSLALAVAGTLLDMDAATFVGWLSAVGSVAAIPVAAVLGRSFAMRPLMGRRIVLLMSVLTTVGTAMLISLAYAAFAAAAIVLSGYDEDMALELGRAIGTFLFGSLALTFFGLLVFGLPGLAISAVSAFVWTRGMRRAFASVDGNA